MGMENNQIPNSALSAASVVCTKYIYKDKTATSTILHDRNKNDQNNDDSFVIFDQQVVYTRNWIANMIGSNLLGITYN